MVITATVKDGKICVQAPFDLKEECKTIPGGRWNNPLKCWTYPATPFTALQAAEIFKGKKMRVSRGFDDLVKQAQLCRELGALKSKDDLPPIPLTRSEPWLHQIQAFWFAYHQPAVMLALDMGVGKSKVVCDLIVNRNHRHTLILCPLSVVQEWPRQFERHAGVHVNVTRLDKGSVVEKVAAARAAFQQAILDDAPCVIVINYDSAWREPFATWAKGAGFDLVVCDESHRIQSHSSKISKFCQALGQKVPYRLCLTGTPFSSGPLSVYGQYRFLDSGIFGTRWEEFKMRYAMWGGYQNRQIQGYIREEELNQKFYSIAVRVESRDVLDLPEALHITRHCELEPQARKAYAALEKDLLAEVEAGTVTVQNALGRLLRLQQITSGWLPLDEGGEVRISEAKQRLLADVLEDLSKREPVVVFCRFQHDLDAVREVCERQGRTCAELSGRARQTEAWRAGEYDVLAVQIAAGGAGVDLTRSHYCIYYSLGFSLAEYLQSLARTLRPGQKSNVTYIHLLAENTVDQKVYDALDAKEEVVERILGVR